MGAVLSKKQETRRYYDKKQVSRSRGLYSRIRSGTGYKRPRPVTYQKPPQARQEAFKILYENMPPFSVLPFMAGDKSPYPLADTAVIKSLSSSVTAGLDCLKHKDLLHDGDQKCGQLESKVSTAEPGLIPQPYCLEYEGFHERGFHIFMIDSDKFINEATQKNCVAIQESIGRIVNEDSFIVIYQSGKGRTAFIADDYSSGDKLFQGFVNRFQDQLKRIVLWKPSWDILSTVEDGENPFTDEVRDKIKFTEDIMEFGRLTGFPGEIKTKVSTCQKPPQAPQEAPQFSGDKSPCPDADLLHDGDQKCGQLESKISTAEPSLIPQPYCLEYEGFHERGFHIFMIDSDKFINEATQKNCVAIQESIKNTINEDSFIIIYQSVTGQPAYIADEYSCGDELFQGLVNRFQDQLMRIVLWKPSWFILCTFEDEDLQSPFSVAVLEKLKMTSDVMELGRLTGFPGEIIRK